MSVVSVKQNNVLSDGKSRSIFGASKNFYEFPKAIGGVETVFEKNGVYYKVHAFTDSGESTLQVLRGGFFEYLVIAGGGAGGSVRTFSLQFAGGGGAGGLRSSVEGDQSGGPSAIQNKKLLLPPFVKVFVGEGGVQTSAPSPQSGKGGDSFLGDIVAIGGGGGGVGSSVTQVSYPENGGSGGGTYGFSGSEPGGGGTEGQGNNGGSGGGGGNAGGGGGGAGSSGDTSGNGGDALASSITGVTLNYAGGGASKDGMPGAGAGAGVESSSNGISGDANTGSGGGGAASQGSADSIGGNGGSGIVIIRYRITESEFNAA